MKSKKEYFKEYHSNHPGYYVLYILSFICDIIGAAIIIPKCIRFLEISDVFGSRLTSYAIGDELMGTILLGCVFWIVGSIFLIAAKVMDKNAANEYERYLRNSAGEQRYNIPYASDNSWTCPKCGIRNQDSINFCNSCGTRKINNYSTNNNYQRAANGAPIPLISVPTVNEWKCPKCGRINQNYVGTCGCGTRKPNA